MLFGGRISYSLYMVHELCLTVMHRTDAFLGRLAPVLGLAAILVAAVLMNRLVEEPCRKFMRGSGGWRWGLARPA